jgi:hypothetical protein
MPCERVEAPPISTLDYATALLELGGATIEPDHGFAGMVWGPRFVSALARTDSDSLSFRNEVCSYMPTSGEARDEGTAIILQHAVNHTIELVSGSLAEEMLLPGAPMLASDDLRQSEAFIALATAMARDLLRPHIEIIRALAGVLQAERSMNGARIDAAIATALARQSLADEVERRLQWRQRIESAKLFVAMFEEKRVAA